MTPVTSARMLVSTTSTAVLMTPQAATITVATCVPAMPASMIYTATWLMTSTIELIKSF